MTQPILRVLARKTPQPGREDAPLVPDPHGTEATPQVRRIIGRRHVQVSPGQWAWQHTDKVEAVRYHHDVAKAVKDGDLYAADEATAKYLGVPWDPTFGGEGAPATETTDSKPADAGGKDS